MLAEPLGSAEPRLKITALTPQIRQCQTLATFRHHLKTHYFQSAFSAT